MIRRFCAVGVFTIIFFFLLIPPAVSTQENDTKKKAGKEVSADAEKAEDRTDEVRPVLSVSPRELDFGVISIGEGSRGSVVLKNAGPGTLKWSVIGPEGWALLEDQRISGTLRDNTANVKIHISSLKPVLNDADTTADVYLVQMGIETDSRMNIYRKSLPPGTHKKVVKLTSNGGTKAVTLRFELKTGEKEPLLVVTPSRIDLGQVDSDEQVAGKLMVTNRGREILRWRAACGLSAEPDTPINTGRYVSFLNASIKGSSSYVPPNHLKESLDISGRWLEKDGYPGSHSPYHVMKYRFWGTGITVFFSVEPVGESISAYVDEKRANALECKSGAHEASECLVAEDLPYGQHVLTVSSKKGHAIIEGVKIYGIEVKRGSPGWISIFPDSGTTTRETDYVNIMVKSQRLNPGYYGEKIAFTSNGGKKVVEISLEVTGDNKQRIIDVYRYVAGSDYVFTAHPETDAVLLQGRGYKKQGIAFRLFSPGTPGTTSFHGWYHPRKKGHFYSHDMRGEGKTLKGYVYKGVIGNIATSRLTNTRELYRWFNPANGSYFYTTDPKGEDSLKKGYRFDGIAGYVR